ncbi:MAG: oligosaccharide flippase family protein [Bacteroidaceae bacterium]|nr:oligosaccharide flippase family protein [Bacteroidaceae bacterium]
MHTNESKQLDHVIKCTGLFGGVQGLNLLINIVRNRITASLLGPVGTGIISLLANFIELVHHSTDFGICFSAIKHVAELFESNDQERITKFIRTVRIWCLLAGLLGITVALIAAIFIKWTDPVNIIMVAPIIGISTIIAGEQAILKGAKQLKRIAVVSVFSTIATLIVTIPIYFLFSFKGIAIALLLNHIAILIITTYHSNKVSPYVIFSHNHLTPHYRSSWYDTIRAGYPMITLGIGYVIAGVFGKGSEFIIRHFILDQSISIADGNAAVGLYTAGYSIVITYASYVFTALEVDFFPRLSAACTFCINSPTSGGANIYSQHDSPNTIINQQIEICALLMAPLLCALVLFMPHMVHFLYTNNYHAAIPMAVCASVFMFLKAFFGPLEYLALAKGNSKMYMFVELVYDILVAIAIPIAYSRFGLIGCGIALSICGIINLVFVFSLYSKRFNFRFDFRLIHIYVIQFILLLIAIIVLMYDINSAHRLLKWTICPMCLIISSIISINILYRETTIIHQIIHKIRH